MFYALVHISMCVYICTGCPVIVSTILSRIGRAGSLNRKILYHFANFAIVHEILIFREIFKKLYDLKIRKKFRNVY